MGYNASCQIQIFPFFELLQKVLKIILCIFGENHQNIKILTDKISNVKKQIEEMYILVNYSMLNLE